MNRATQPRLSNEILPPARASVGGRQDLGHRYLRLVLRFGAACDKALPAARFEVAEKRLSRSTFDAAEAAALPV